MQRRAFLGATVATAAAGIAGCVDQLSGDSASEDAAETTESGDGEKDSPGLPAWAQWIPTSVLSAGTDSRVVTFDLGEIRADYPRELYETLNLGSVRRSVGVSPDQMQTETLVSPPDADGSVVIRGSMRREAMVEAAEPEVTVEDTYRDFSVLSNGLAVGDNVIIASDRPRRMLDIRYGGVESLTDSGDGGWRKLYAAVGPWDFYYMSPGSSLESPTYDPNKWVLTIDAVGDDVAQYTFRFLFEDEDAAADAYDRGQEKLADAVQVSDQATVAGFERSGRIVTLTVKLEGLRQAFSGGGTVA